MRTPAGASSRIPSSNARYGRASRPYLSEPVRRAISTDASVAIRFARPILDKLRYISLHTVGAAAFIFVLNFFVLGTNLQTALIWAIGFGVMAFILARQHTRG
jgi:hypothetical protein